MRRRLLFVAAALLLAVNAAMAQAAKTAYAVYCEENETLYFLNSSETLSEGDNYNSLTITKAWPVDFTKTIEHEWFGCAYRRVVFDTSFKEVKPTNFNFWFAGSKDLLSVEGLENLDTSEATEMRSMFLSCVKLTGLDLSSFNTAKVMTMYDMFGNCNSLTALDLSSFTTENLENMKYMFSGCTALQNLDIRNFKPKQGTDVAYMFKNCTALTELDIRNFYVSEGISTGLAKCDKLMKLNMSNATGEVNLLADNTAFDGRGMMISVPESYDGDISAENYIVKPGGTSFARTFTSGNMSTICLPYAVDAASLEGQGTLYKYVGIAGDEVKFASVTGLTEPGEAYLFKPATGEEIIFSGTEAIADLPEEVAEGAAPGLYGTYTGKTFTADEAGMGIYFGWSGGSFWRAGENAEVKHNRAYLKTSGAISTRLSVKLDDKETTGISEVNATAPDNAPDNAPAYDLMGRRVGADYKGIVIKNGKKFLSAE